MTTRYLDCSLYGEFASGLLAAEEFTCGLLATRRFCFWTARYPESLLLDCSLPGEFASGLLTAWRVCLWTARCLESLLLDCSLPGEFASGLLAAWRVCLWTARYQTACLQIANGYPDCSLPELLTVHPAPTYFFMVYHRNERNVNIFSG